MIRPACRCFRAAALTPALAILAMLAPTPASAHLLQATALNLDLGSSTVKAELQLPLDQLGMALSLPLAGAPAAGGTSPAASTPPEAVVPRFGSVLIGYIQEHIRATAPDGRAFAVSIGSMAVERIVDGDCLVVDVVLEPPPGASARVFTLNYDVIQHRVVTHKIFVSIRRDFENGVLGGQPELAGVLKFQATSLSIDRSSGTWWRGFRAVFTLGARHIAEGTDHMLFLLVLLLPAPLLVRRGRWSGSGSMKQSAVGVIKIVTAFTLGHSITLIAGALGAIHVPGRPVEILIAASILVSAIHAMRPLFAGREPLVAGGFGLVHGLAFATVLADFGYDAWTLGISILGFNLGIEAMQILVVTLTTPWLALLSRSPLYSVVRIGGAVVAAVAACGWIAERAMGIANPVAPVIEYATARPIAGVVLLAAASVMVEIGRRRSGSFAAKPDTDGDGVVDFGGQASGTRIERVVSLANAFTTRTRSDTPSCAHTPSPGPAACLPGRGSAACR